MAGHSKAWIKAVDMAIDAGVPIEEFKGVQAFGSNVDQLEKLNDKLIEARETVEKARADLATALKAGAKSQGDAEKFAGTIRSQSKLYRKAAENIEKALKKEGNDKGVKAANALQGGLDGIDALTDKNINLTFDFK
ncbi:MAG: hypothetical protein SGJ20_02760 [Planctomycetota bacterium]|nr:hypothetical protein [Planctomycetota bacterium]